MPAPIVHRTVRVGEIDMHVAEQGEGEPVMMCHGFPGLWFTWRHQMAALAAAGYRAIAPDMRGYGRTDAPADAAVYDRVHTVTDLTGLLDVLGLDDAVFAGHDFGAHLTWDLPAWAPERVRALIQFSVPRMPRQPIAPSAAFARMAQRHFVHFHYFQQAGVADAELAARPREFLARIFHALGSDGDYLSCWNHPSEGNGYLDVLPPAPDLPWPWLTGADFDHYAAEFTRTGFIGGLNWYRAQDLVWEQTAQSHDLPITVPTLFIAGEQDPVLSMMGAAALESTAAMVPGLTSTLVVPGAGHFVQMEAAPQVNEAMLAFLRGLD